MNDEVVYSWPAGVQGRTAIPGLLICSAMAGASWIGVAYVGTVMWVPALFFSAIVGVMVWGTLWQIGAVQRVVLRPDRLMVQVRRRGRMLRSREVPWFRVRRVDAGQDSTDITVLTDIGEAVLALRGDSRAEPTTHGRIAAGSIVSRVRHWRRGGLDPAVNALAEAREAGITFQVERLTGADRIALAMHIEHARTRALGDVVPPAESIRESTRTPRPP